ncbi:hypothetical protein SAMN05421636_102139 [Pricia antarctica]|uniref:Tetratricopeptide repeat-containing protein n=1 Tax=Pricia antarctica TaxID=641691 RepID=A0A1G6Y819_9FLAO|nr:hypothetical protein [Pricia antarctica]SDD86133.1 hypothetical protein SAMN05421636_102139 [Pricia antarctica]
MNVKDFTYLLQHPDKVVSPLRTNQLEEVLEEFPYFQAARSLHLKGLKSLNSFKYNNALKVTAAYTADREVLFDFITSKNFLQNSISDTLSGKTTSLVDTEIQSDAVIPQKSVANNSEAEEDTALPLTQAEADALFDPGLFTSKDPKIDKALKEAENNTSRDLELGEPLPFTKKEKYSFSEWLQLSSFKTVKRDGRSEDEKEMENIHFPMEENPIKSKRFELIDKFIADNPKIKPQKDVPKAAIRDSVNFDTKELMTETLAKVYLEQKKYKKAIQAFKILSLKYPEKSGFFADRIKAVERLKEDNSQ